MVEALLLHGADPGARNRRGDDAAAVARANGNEELACLLETAHPTQPAD